MSNPNVFNVKQKQYNTLESAGYMHIIVALSNVVLYKLNTEQKTNTEIILTCKQCQTGSQRPWDIWVMFWFVCPLATCVQNLGQKHKSIRIMHMILTLSL